MSGKKKTYVYLDDRGQEHLIRLLDRNAEEAGFRLAELGKDISLEGLPPNIVPRYINCKSDSGLSRKLIVPQIDSELWTGKRNEVELVVIRGADVRIEQFRVTSRIGEKRRSVHLRKRP